jgi:hypothetical protein
MLFDESHLVESEVIGTNCCGSLLELAAKLSLMANF